MDNIFLELEDRYVNEKSYEPKAYINGCALTKSQLVNILLQLDIQTGNYDDAGVYTLNDVSFAIDDSKDVYVNDGKYLDRDTLNAWMQAKGITMAELSRATGISYQSIHSLCKGISKPSDETRQKIVDALEITTL